MPKVDIAKVPVKSGTFYPAEFQAECAGRHKQALGDVVGLTQFGVNITHIAPGSASSLRHYHEREDEFIYMLAGELVLIEDEGETVLKVGERPTPEPGPGEVRIRVKASGVNPSDVKSRRGATRRPMSTSARGSTPRTTRTTSSIPSGPA